VLSQQVLHQMHVLSENAFDEFLPLEAALGVRSVATVGVDLRAGLVGGGDFTRVLAWIGCIIFSVPVVVTSLD